MKPFDLEAAKRGDPIHCLGVGALEVDFVGMSHTGHVVIETRGVGIRKVSSDALRMAPAKRTVWVNLYPEYSRKPNGRPWGSACWHDTQESANSRGGSARIGGKAYPLEIEE